MDNGSNSTLNVYPNIEAIAEFKVLTSNYGAQYGRNGSGTVEVETKSGGSYLPRQRFRIPAQRFLQRKAMGSGRQTGPPEPAITRNMTSATPSAARFLFRITTIPSRKKTFFFFSEEWRREKNPNTIHAKRSVGCGTQRKLLGPLPGSRLP